MKFGLKDILLSALALAVAINIFEFLPIDRSNNPRYRAIHVYDTPDITNVSSVSKTVNRRFGLFIEQGKHFPGSTIITPGTGLFAKKEFVGGFLALGRVNQFQRASYDVESLVTRSSKMAQIAISGPVDPKYFGGFNTFEIRIASESPRKFYLATVHDKILLIDSTVYDYSHNNKIYNIP